MSDTVSADSKGAGAAVAAPASGATIASVTGLMSGGHYKVNLNIGQTGTIDTAHLSNLLLQSGGVTLMTLPSVALDSPIILDQITLAPGATDLTVVTNAAFAASSIVMATIVATRVG